MNVRLFLAEALPFLLAFYLLDGLRRVRVHHCLFASWTGRRYRLRRTGWHLAALTPSSRTFVVPHHAVVPTLTGVLVPRDLRFETAHTDTRYFVSIPYAELEDLSVRDRAVWGGARNLLELESPELAAALVARIGEIRDRAPGERGAAIAEQLRRDLSLVGVRERLAEVDRATGVVRFAAWAALALVFGILPLAVYLPDAMRTPPTALVLFLVLAYAVLIRFGLRAERAVSSRGRDWGRLFPMIASPITSLHLAAEIGRYALVDFDRAVVAVALLDGEGREAVLRREVQRCEIAATITGEDAQVYWSARLETLHALAREVGLDPGRLSGAPESIPVGEKYCPLCDAGYRGSAERCADCGVPLRVREPA